MAALDPVRCRCCGMVPVDFGDATWCLCEPARPGMLVTGTRHECTAVRRDHRHAFGRLIAEEIRGVHVATVFQCRCGQERRLALDSPAA